MKEDTPGPGSYAPKLVAIQAPPKSAKSGVFGTTSKRFVEKVELNPGPGSYTYGVEKRPQTKSVPMHPTKLQKAHSMNLHNQNQKAAAALSYI
jgi:hypothetical protein